MTAGACPLQQWGDEIVCTAPACGLRWDKADERPDCRLGVEGDFDMIDTSETDTPPVDWSRGASAEFDRRGKSAPNHYQPPAPTDSQLLAKVWGSCGFVMDATRSSCPACGVTTAKRRYAGTTTPTDAMLDAGAKAFREQPIKGDPREAARAIWKAMHDVR